MGVKAQEISASRQSYKNSMTRYAMSATPVSNTSVVNLRMPSTHSSTSATALVIIVPVLSSLSSARGLCTRLPYSTARMFSAVSLAKRRT